MGSPAVVPKVPARPRVGSAPVWYEAVMWVLMSAAEREDFLAGVRVGVLSAAVGTAGRTLAVPGALAQPGSGHGISRRLGRGSRDAAPTG
jgi:hypothetical protein